MDEISGRNATIPLADRSPPPGGRWDPPPLRERPPLQPTAVVGSAQRQARARLEGSRGLLAPAVRDLFRAMAERRVSIAQMARASGLHHRTLEEWHAGRNPRLRQLSAALAVVGLRIAAVPDA